MENEKRFYCNWCQQVTNHALKSHHYSQVDYFALGTGELLHEDDEQVNPDENSYVDYRLWYCKGCDSGTLEIYYYEQPWAPWSEFYPRRELNKVYIKEYRNLPLRLKKMYQEVIISYQNNLTISCAIGLRALIEGVCSDRKITKGNLIKRLDGLKEILPEHIVDQLHSFRYLGNTAVHELEPPSQYELKMHIDVIESLLDYIYELEYKSNQLQRHRKNTKS